ncbi:hypothetical protein K9M79_01990 [Candidatus Woesearchaeota archaeon]|nr:hypothetical protein [Candidatus Woesearchaeota archaeon]
MSQAKITSHILLFLLIISLLVSGVFAEETFIVSKSTSLNACQCQILDNQLTVRNTGGSEFTTIIIEDDTSERSSSEVARASTYQLYKSGSAAAWTTIVPSIFTLMTNEEAVVSEVISVPCDASGNYDLITTVQTQGGARQDYLQNINVKKCTNNEIFMPYTQVKTCPCEPVVFNFTLSNAGAFTETYDFYVNKYAEYINIYPSASMSVQPGRMQQGYVIVDLPCDVYGDETITLRSKSRGSKLIATVPLNMNISRCYDFSIGFPSDISICRSTGQYNYTLDIENDVKIKNSYSTKITPNSSDIQVIYDESLIDLDGFNSTEKQVSIIAPNQSGSYILDMYIQSGYGLLFDNRTVPVDIVDCYVPEFSDDFTFEGDAEPGKTCCEDEIISTVSIKNAGTKEANLDLTLDGDYFELSRESLSLDPGEDKNIDIYSKFNCDGFETGNKTAVLVVTNHDYPDIVYTHEIVHYVMSANDCYDLNIEGPRYIDTFYKDTNHSYQISNVGIRGGNYQLSYPKDYWLTMDADSFSIQPGESFDMKLMLSPNESVVSGTYKIPVQYSVPGKDASFNETISIHLKTNWIKIILENTASFFSWAVDSVSWWVGHQYQRFSDYMFMVPEDTACNETQKEDIDQIIKYFQDTQTPEYKFNLMYEDQIYQLNLSEMFTDPDGDVLSYTSEETENLTIHIFDEIAKIVPDTDFCGIRRTSFTAYDYLGESANSSTITIIVQNTEEKSRFGRVVSALSPVSLWEWIKTYFIYLIIGLILLFIIIAILSSLPSKEEKMSVKKLDFKSEKNTKAVMKSVKTAEPKKTNKKTTESKKTDKKSTEPKKARKKNTEQKKKNKTSKKNKK